MSTHKPRLRYLSTTHFWIILIASSSLALCRNVPLADGQASYSDGCRRFSAGRFTALCSRITQCIAEEKICDGIADCVDLSDEKDCSSKENITKIILEATSNTPMENTFCAKLFSEDCLDGAGYRCPYSGECIARDKLCDQSIQCPNAEDEILCCDVEQASYSKGCEIFTSGRYPFECQVITQCVSEDSICDGKHDCKDFTDEIQCHSTTPRGPQLEEVFCHQLFSEDCHNVSSDFPYRCPSNGECIGSDDLCDQIIQCPKAQDEIVCCDFKQASYSESCELFTDGRYPIECLVISQCISEDRICDGKLDCRDFTDEIRCPPKESAEKNVTIYETKTTTVESIFLHTITKPRRNEFCARLFSEDCQSISASSPYRCPSNGECIGRDQLCDQNIHCPEAEDEIVCCDVDQPSHSKGCRIFTGDLLPMECSVITQCVSEDSICDGKADCNDFTDEIQCHESPLEKEFCDQLFSEDCPDAFPYRCPSNGKCIGRDDLCDQSIKCPNAEDEIVCCEVGQASYSKGCKNFTKGQLLAECSVVTQCIAEDSVCDGKIDCVDFTDEIECMSY